MKPNQPNYDKYFRRPLAWLLSFGMIASYVPATYAQEESDQDKEARTYYEDSPLSETATLSDSIPLVGGNEAETLPEFYQVDTTEEPSEDSSGSETPFKHYIDLGTYDDGKDYPVYLAQVSNLSAPTLKVLESASVEVPYYDIVITYTEVDDTQPAETLITFEDFDAVKSFLALKNGNTVRASVEATPRSEETSLTEVLTASFTWGSISNPYVGFKDVRAHDGTDYKEVEEGDTIEVEESNATKIKIPEFSVYDLDNVDKVLQDIYTYSLSYSTTDFGDGEDVRTFSNLVAAQSYLKTVGNTVTVTIHVTVGDEPYHTENDFSYTWETIENALTNNVTVTLPKGYDGVVRVDIDDQVPYLELPAYVAKDSNGNLITGDGIEITYTSTDGVEDGGDPATFDTLEEVSEYLAEATGNTVLVTITATDKDEHTGTASFTWQSDDLTLFTVTATSGSNGSISTDNYEIKDDQFEAIEGSSITFHFKPTTALYEPDTLTVNGVEISDFGYSYTIDNIEEDTTVNITYKSIDKPFVNLDFGYKNEAGEDVVQTSQINSDGNLIAPPSAPNREGYHFLGWYEDLDDESTLVTEESTFYSGDTIYAKWELGIYTITFKLYQGKFPSAVACVEKTDENGTYWEATLTTSDVEANRGQLGADLANYKPDDGYNNFVAWYLDDFVQISTDYRFTQDSTVLPIWIEAYKIDLTYNGATSSNGFDSYHTDQYKQLPTLPVPSRIGYTFKGWWTGAGTSNTESDAGWGTQVIVASTQFTGPTMIYARWMQGYGTVTFNYGYDKEDTIHELDAEGKLDPDLYVTKPERPGYTFDTWRRDSALGELVSDNKFNDGDTLYATWIIVPYTVTLNENYGDVPKEYEYTTIEDHKLSEEAIQLVPERVGYTFDHWSTAPDETGEKIEITSSFLEHTTLYAHWEPKTELIILDPTEGEFENFNDIDKIRIDPDTQTIYDYDAFEKLTLPVRQGYEFSHWEDKHDKLVTPETTFVEGDSIFARWTPLTYTLSFLMNGGLVDGYSPTPTEIADMTITYDTAVGTLTPTRKENATFAGWYVADDSGAPLPDNDGNYTQITEETIWNYIEDQTVVALYNYPITATVEGEGTISTDYGDDGIDSETDKVNVFEGDDITFTFTPDTGHRIKSITVDGLEIDLDKDTNYDKTAKTYTLTGIKEGGTIHFELEMVPIYEITITSGEDTPLTNGSFTSTSTTVDNVVFVTEGDNAAILFIPDEWYRIKSITANGEAVDVTDSSRFSFAVTELMENIDLVVEFEELPKHTITATAGENGSVLPTYEYLGGLVNDKMEIYDGESELFKFYPSVGFVVSSVVVTDSSGDEKDVTIYAENDQFLMSKVEENMAIHVTFTEDLSEEEAIIVTLDGNGGNLTGSSKIEVNELGNLENMPADPTREGYIFTGWWNATTGGTQISTSFIFTDDTTIYAQWTQDLEGVDYTVTFDSSGGSSISAQLVPATKTVVKPTDPVRSGYTFQGWYTTSLFTTAWDFAKDAVTEDMTLYAKWTAGTADNDTSVSQVVDHNGNPVSGATVSLIRNGTTYYSSTTDGDGYYAFRLLSAGYYNLVVTTNDGYINTTALTVYSSTTTLPLVKLPEYSISSSVSITQGALAQTVGGIDTLANLVAAKLSNFSKILVDIAISTYSSSSSQSTITNAKDKSDVIASFFDVDVTKTITTTTGTTYTESITDADSLVEIMLSIPTVYQGKDTYSIYRIYNGSVDRITTTANSNSERIVVSSDGTRMSLFVKKFSGSAYALAYSDANSSVAEHDVTVKSYLNGVESSSTSIGSVAITGSSALEGDVVTVTPYPNFGFSLDNVVVKTDAGKYLTVTTNSNGTFSFTQSTSNANVSVHFTTTLSAGNNTSDSTANTVTPEISYFSDVSVTDPFCAAINEVVSLGLMTGTGNGSFSPHDSITRGMIVAILQYMSGQNSTLVPGFVDVFPTDYYYYSVAWAVSSGIVVGYDDYTFRPDQAITREELAAILYSYSQKFGSYDVLWYFPLSFADSDGITFWAKDAVTWCVNRDVLSARYNNFFLPQGIATRAEAAVAVVALLNSQK